MTGEKPHERFPISLMIQVVILYAQVPDLAEGSFTTAAEDLVFAALATSRRPSTSSGIR
jgi:hypothetical protein